MSYLEDLAKEEMRKMSVPIIETDIILDFCRNMEYRDNYVYSNVEHEGIKVTAVFDIRQFSRALNGLANYLYKELEEEAK